MSDQNREPYSNFSRNAIETSFPEESKAMDALQTRLQFRFNNVRWLYEACTHRSVGSYPLVHLEKLECMGDAIAGAAIVDLLSRGDYSSRFNQGDLTTFRKSCVSRAGLSAVSSEFEVFKCIMLGSQEKRLGLQDTDKLRADHLEAVIGAMFFDSGYNQTLSVIQTLFKTQLTKCITGVFNCESIVDMKSYLNLIIQSQFRESPKYITTSRSGPDHKPTLTVAVLVMNIEIAEGSGGTKKIASENAAEFAVQEYQCDRNLFFERVGIKSAPSTKEYETRMNAKSQLNLIVQSRYRESPQYITTSRSGSCHAPTFTVALFVKDKQIAEGSGTSTKLASGKAAEIAMQQYDSDEETFFQHIDSECSIYGLKRRRISISM